MAPTEAQVLERLRRVEDPDLRRDIVSLGFVKNVKIDGGRVAFDIDLTTPACPVREDLESQARTMVAAIQGVEEVAIRVTSSARAPGVANLAENLRGVRAVVAVASGKGGVGKSTVAVNLAVALARQGAKVGILDADLYGPTIPGMLGILSGGDGALQSTGPIQPGTAHGVRALSLGMFLTKDTPVVWRGPMATKLVQTFLSQAHWGDLDYLLVDLPPGTGDIQLTLAQSVPLTGVVIVTTPQETAANIAERGARMFPKLNVPILGVVENMSHYECPDCGHVAHIFRDGGGQRVADVLGAPLLGQIPLDESVADAGDAGEPVVARDAASAPARAYEETAKRLVRRVSTTQYALRAGERATPKEYRVRSDGRLQVTWTDGHVGEYDQRRLRGECPCAHCVDEWTGQRRVTAKDVAANVEVNGADTIGRYATKFNWSDGHATGLYTFARLRALCECPECQKLRLAPVLRASA